MKKYIVPSIKVVNIDNEALLTESNFSTASAVELSAGSLGARQRGRYDFDEEFEADFE